MLAHSLVHSLVVTIFAGLLLAAAIVDFRHFRIPNPIVLSVAALYPAHVIASPQPVAWTYGLAFGAAMFVLGAIFFAAKMMGGGDVKLMAAVSMWAAPYHMLPFLFITLAGAIVLAVLMAIRFAADGAKASGNPSITGTIANFRHVPIFKMSVPYGVGIAAGGIYVAARLLVG